MRESQLLEQLKLHCRTGQHAASLSPQLPANGLNQELINELPLLTNEKQSRVVVQELKSIIESKRAGAPTSLEFLFFMDTSTHIGLCVGAFLAQSCQI